MPIRRELRFFYPIDWKELSVQVRFHRAAGRCERCGRPHRTFVLQAADGRWRALEGEEEVWRDDRGRRAPPPPPGEVMRRWILLGTAHLDHDPTNSRPRNLAALCQRCHLRHDRKEHGRRRRQGYLRRRALGDLFEGPYRGF
jgi:hypothetical protein